MYTFVILATLVLLTKAIPFRLGKELFLRDLKRRHDATGLEKELLMRDLQRRHEIMGCRADPDSEVMFIFDTSDVVNDTQFKADKEFAAEASSYLAENVKIHAAVYGEHVEGVPPFDFNSAQDVLVDINTEVGGPRNAAEALRYAESIMHPPGTKIVVLFVNGPLQDSSDAAKVAESLPKKFKVYTAVNTKQLLQLEPELKKMASEYGFLPSKGMHIAESFQLDLHVVYKFEPGC